MKKGNTLSYFPLKKVELFWRRSKENPAAKTDHLTHAQIIVAPQGEHAEEIIGTHELIGNFRAEIKYMRS
jgi:hypothetical protein